MNTITIDCGASFIKGALFQDGEMVKKLQLRSPEVHKEMSLTETVQIQKLISLVYKIISELAGNEKEVSLCVANEMHGFILAYEDGTPFTDYISWQKEWGSLPVCGQTPVDILKVENPEDIFFTGMPIRSGLPSSNLLYLSMRGHWATASSKLYFYTLGDYILKRLSGKEPVCHPTNAAATGLYDLRSGNWNPSLIRAVGGEQIIFPLISGEPFIFNIGSLKIHALPALGDQQAALLGSGLDKLSYISFNLGTGAQVSKLTLKPECSTEYQIRPYFYGQYLKTVPHLPSGRALNVYIRFLKNVFDEFGFSITEDEIWEVLLQLRPNPDTAQLQCDLSFFENPITDRKVGAIGNIGEYSLTLGNLVYAVFNQMVSNYILAAKKIEPDSSAVARIIFSGGVARKIKVLRSLIQGFYSENAAISIAADETLLGLFKYSQEN